MDDKINVWELGDHVIYLGQPGTSISFSVYTHGLTPERPDQSAAKFVASRLNRLEAALDLWREWFEKDGEPHYASEQGGDVHCFFCGAWLEHDSHESDCIWARAKELLEVMNGR
jgi:hypothetical protein